MMSGNGPCDSYGPMDFFSLFSYETIKQLFDMGCNVMPFYNWDYCI